MKKIAILTSGILPVPAVQGGAVENLIDFYLEYNEQHKLHDITVYSVWHPNVKKHPALQSTVNHYYYIDTSSYFAKLKRKLYKMFHADEYYNYFIEYFFEQAYTHIAKERYDYIVLENRPGYALKLLHSNSHIVLHLHNDLLNNITPQNCAIFRSLTGILTVSNYIKTRVSTIVSSGCEISKIITVYNGIDLKRFSQNASLKICRSVMGFSNDDFVLVFSGRINRDKGISELIDALLLLEFHNVKLMVIGSTFFGNVANEDNFVQSLKNKAKAISQRIVFTGFIDYNRMPDFLSLADVAVIPSIWDDPFPTTILEAQAMGLPIICSNRGGIPEGVRKENAIIIPTGSQYIYALANAIRLLYNSPQRRASMSAAALQNAPYFNKERYADDFFEAIESLSASK